jgi:putative heme iron utilization protein
MTNNMLSDLVFVFAAGVEAKYEPVLFLNLHLQHVTCMHRDARKALVHPDKTNRQRRGKKIYSNTERKI